MSRLRRGWFQRPATAVAPDLLGRVLARRSGSGEVLRVRIVETEAYEPDDPASHSFRGPTRRNASMFGRPGHLYVYFTYGMHWCANAVCGDDGVGVAVLLRAAEPLEGLEAMWARRPKAKRERDLLAGPARLCQAFELTGAEDGCDLVRASHGVALVDDGTPPPSSPIVGPRIGLSVGAELPWRWCTPASLHLSKPA